MADSNAQTAEGFQPEKSSPLKSAFQWAAAFVAPLGCEASTTAFEAMGNAYDYTVTATKYYANKVLHGGPKG